MLTRHGGPSCHFATGRERRSGEPDPVFLGWSPLLQPVHWGPGRGTFPTPQTSAGPWLRLTETTPDTLCPAYTWPDRGLESRLWP